MSHLQWKPNGEETKHHSWGRPEGEVQHEAVTPPPAPGDDPRTGYEDTEWRARASYVHLARGHFGADILPMADSDFGPGSLALALGCEPGFSRQTGWFENQQEAEQAERLADRWRQRNRSGFGDEHG
jgi:hypothetical protein